MPAGNFFGKNFFGGRGRKLFFIFLTAHRQIIICLSVLPVRTLTKIISDISVNIVSAVAADHLSVSDTAFKCKSAFL